MSETSETTSHLSRANHLSNDDFQLSPVRGMANARSKRTLLSKPGTEQFVLFGKRIDSENQEWSLVHTFSKNSQRVPFISTIARMTQPWMIRGDFPFDFHFAQKK